MDSLIPYTIAGLAVFTISVGLIVVLALILNWGKHRENGLIPYLFYPVMLIIALTVVLSGRNLALISDSTANILVKPAAVAWLSRITSVILLLVSGERILRFLFKREKQKINLMLLFAFCFYFFTSVFCSAVLGAHTSFSHDNLYVFIIGVAVFLASKYDSDIAVTNARNALFVFICASLAYIVINSNMVLWQNYSGYIPGLNIRLAGLSPHPNSYGQMTLVFLLCLWNKPFSSKLLNHSAWSLGLISLFLAQSKTSWIGFVICSACLAYFGHREHLKQRIFNIRQPILIVSVISLVMILAILTSLMLMFGNIGGKLIAYLNTNQGYNLLTLTGRNQIWEIAIQEWQRYPIFGYGLTIFDEAFRARIGLPAAVHAHNQFFQVLSSAGLVGALGLVIYAITLMYYSFKSAISSQGLTVAILLLIFIRSISEVPLSMISLGFDQITQLLLLMVLTSHWTNYQKQIETRQSSRSFRNTNGV